ncbi:hypothetical protein C5S35_01165 [Candidatus Methanophagaceae archaeon]|nr:hypothetical protein C5S35_01165 [Methanophagales archaeon]
MSEKYLKWFPIEGIPFPLDLEELCKNEYGLSILLNSEDKSDQFLHIHFSECEAINEIADEFKSKFWHEVDIEEDYSLFIVENSEWLESFHVEAENHYRELPLIHYAIWTTENWIDVLSSAKPLVQWVNK